MQVKDTTGLFENQALRPAVTRDDRFRERLAKRVIYALEHHQYNLRMRVPKHLTHARSHGPRPLHVQRSARTRSSKPQSSASRSVRSSSSSSGSSSDPPSSSDPDPAPSIIRPDFAAIAALAERDRLYVSPACKDPKVKHPCIRWKPFQERRPTDAEIEYWIKRFPDRNGCYMTGPVLGRIVIECDSPAAIAWVRRMGMPPTQTVRSRRGPHYHLKHPSGLYVPTVAGKIHEGVDIRGDKGIAVAAGSIHRTGFKYHWARGRSPQEVELADAPQWLIDWIRTYSERRERAASVIVPARPFGGRVNPWAKKVIGGELESLRTAIGGTRNDSLARVSFKLGQLAAGGEARADELKFELYSIAACWPDQKKAADTIDRSFAAGQEHPRSAPPSPILGMRYPEVERATDARLAALARLA